MSTIPDTMIPTRITAAQIDALRVEAAQAGDDAQVRLCDAALDETHDTSQQAAWARCERVILDAAAALAD